MARNKEDTKSRILQAVGKLLAKSGFNSLGINAIAKEAGVDKVLIYRYFTDLPTLLQTFGREGDYLSGMVIPPELENSESLADGLVNWLMYFQKELEERPITQEIIRWELVEGNELTKELRDIRRDIATERLKFFDDKFGLPADQDTVAIMSILGSAIIYLQLRSKISPTFSGLDFSTVEGWSRIDAAISTIIYAVMAQNNTPQKESQSTDPQSTEKELDSIAQD